MDTSPLRKPAVAPVDDETPDFLARFRGPFRGVLRWDQLDALWTTVLHRTGPSWYIYAVGEPPPATPATAAELEVFLREVGALLRREHDEDYCGIVYADDLEAPTFIKIFDPNNLGVVCGYSTNPPLPGWILSTQKPEALLSSQPVTAARARWWRRVLGLAAD